MWWGSGRITGPPEMGVLQLGGEGKGMEGFVGGSCMCQFLGGEGEGKGRERCIHVSERKKKEEREEGRQEGLCFLPKIVSNHLVYDLMRFGAFKFRRNEIDTREKKVDFH